ncbi:unnamed protein product [Lactuca saligna]|uniref:Uncharacterized protein n=1 Tax=Lactuca saligna TaxID=75948 RepID=A0AA36EHI4_LACSI|nr:unnamed protein product [Lactuca saligna]
MFQIVRGNAAIRQNHLYPRILRWFHIRMLTWEKVCDVFDVDQDEVHLHKKKMLASDIECSTPHYLSYITNMNCESSDVSSSVRYNFRKDRNENVDGSPRVSNRVNEDDDVDNPPEFDCRKQKQIVKEKEKKKKKKVVSSKSVDAENHIPEPPIAKPSRPVRLLKPSQYLSSPYVSISSKCPRDRTSGVIRNEPPPLYLLAIPDTFIGAHVDIWRMLLNERRPNDARWTIMSSSFFGACEMFQWAGSVMEISLTHWMDVNLG